MSQPDLRAAMERYRCLDTDALLELWSRESRLAWAEDLLRRELVNRGISDENLKQLVEARSEFERSIDEDSRQTEFSALGRFMVLFPVGTLMAIAGNLLGFKAGVIVAIAGVAIYALLLTRYIRYLNRKFGPDAIVPLAKRWTELAAVVLLAGVLFYLLAR